MILDPIALATEGQLAPAAGGAYCPAPLTLVSGGVIVLEVAADGMADPRTFREFDVGYYRARAQAGPRDEEELKADELTLQQYLEQLAREQRAEDVERTRLGIRIRNTELESRVEALEQERAELDTRLAELAARAEEVLEAMRLVLEQLRRRRNERAAIAATMLIYY